MITGYLVTCKQGAAYPKWAPMGLTEIDGKWHLTADDPWTIFRKESEAEKWIKDAAIFHEDTEDQYKIQIMEIET